MEKDASSVMTELAYKEINYIHLVCLKQQQKLSSVVQGQLPSLQSMLSASMSTSFICSQSSSWPTGRLLD